MEAEGTLEVVAEIAIAITGFAGIVGALAGGRLRPDHPHIWLPFWALIEGGLGVLFAALFPMLPHYFGLADRPVWAVSSGFVVVLIVCHIVFMSPRFLRAIRHRSWVRLHALEIPLQFAFLIALLSQLLNALGVGLQQSVGGFLLGLYCLLLGTTLNFAYLIYVLVRPEDESAA